MVCKGVKLVQGGSLTMDRVCYNEASLSSLLCNYDFGYNEASDFQNIPKSFRQKNWGISKKLVP